MIEAKLKTWVLCFKPRPDNPYWSAQVHYWSGKENGGHWVDDLSQATHYPTKGRAKGTMTTMRKFYKRCTWFDFTDEDRMFIGEIDANVQIDETETRDEPIYERSRQTIRDLWSG